MKPEPLRPIHCVGFFLYAFGHVTDGEKEQIIKQLKIWSRYPVNACIIIGYLGSIPRRSRHFALQYLIKLDGTSNIKIIRRYVDCSFY
jgi:hypothetical protein